MNIRGKGVGGHGRGEGQGGRYVIGGKFGKIIGV